MDRWDRTVRRWSTWIVIGWCVAVAGCHTLDTGFLNRSVAVNGDEYRYQVYVPREHQPSNQKWPVILVLHGSGEYGSDGLRQTDVGLASVIRRHPERVPALVVFPQAHADGTPGWEGVAGRAALTEVDRTIKEFSGDPARVYLTGYSAGGYGSWYLASHYPGRFAAVVIVCGFISGGRGSSGIVYPPIVPESEPDAFVAVARQVASLPVWIFHGAADPNVPVDQARGMYAALTQLGANVQYTELAGVGHNAWDPAYGRADLLNWLLQQQRR